MYDEVGSIDILVAEGADINQKNKAEKTPLIEGLFK
jgi:hypothetical protein